MAAVEILRVIREQKISHHRNRGRLRAPPGAVFRCIYERDNFISSLPPFGELTYPEGYRSGHNGAVLKTVRAQAHAGSNPAPSAMKNSSFVRWTKEEFFHEVALCEG